MAAESIGLAASFTGLVSLGIQVTSGIIKYVDAFKNRQEELEFVKRQGEVLRAALLAVDSSLRSHNQSGDVPAAVAQSMQLFEKELSHVQTLHTALADSDTQSLTARLVNKKKRVTFAFNRPKIQELGVRIQKAGDALQLTLNLLGLQVSKQNLDTLAAVGSSTRAISSEVSLVRSELAAIEAPVVAIKDRLSLLQYGVDSNSQLLISQYEALTTQAQGRSEFVLRNVQEITDAVQQLAQLQSRREEEMTRQHKEMTKNLGQILEHLQQSHGNGTTRQAVVRGLASKPALLKELSDKFQPSGQIHDQVAEPDLFSRPFQMVTKSSIRHRATQPVTRRICICPRLQTATKSKWMQLGDTCFSNVRETISHWPSCPMAKMDSQKRSSMGIRYNGLVRLLRTAVNVSFVMTTGAGGFSISPNFTCSPTVDDKLNPAFRIMSLIHSGLLYLDKTNPESFIMACVRRLTRLLDDRKVCATAVDRQNRSLMHYAILALEDAERAFYGEKHYQTICSIFVELVQMLLSYGIAAFELDLEGTSPLVKLNTRLFDYDIPQAVVDVLTQANPENKPLALDRSCIARVYKDSRYLNPLALPISLYKLSSSFAEVCESGPLSMAVIRGDANELRHILNRAQGSIAETNIFGQTPFHLAAAKPQILEILLKHGDRSTLRQRDVSGFTALETAMVLTSDYCQNRGDVVRCDGSECRCCQCVDLFFDIECDIRMHKLAKLDDAPQLYRFLSTASELARRKYVYYMKKRQISAIRSTSSSPHASTKSGDCNLFSDSGIGKARSNTTGSLQPEVADDMSWVFLEIDDPHLAALFYRHGFQPHPSLLTRFRRDLIFREKRMNYAYLDWLLLNAVDPYFRSSKLPASTDDSPHIGLFGAHFVFYLISLSLNSRPYNNISWQDTRSWDKYMALTAKICRQNLSDGCQCYCTTDGCSPFTWMMKGSSLMSGPQAVPAQINHWDIVNLVSHYSRCGLELTSLTYKAAIRYATFGALGLIHTCCDARDLVQGSGDWENRGDVDTVNEEQAPLLKVLEDLVEEFEEKAVEFLRADSSGNSSFAKFWTIFWKVRIEEELEKLEGEELTDAERLGAEEIGVRWTVSRGESEALAGDPYDKEDVEYWFYKLDEICPEYVEPWPEELCRVSESP